MGNTSTHEITRLQVGWSNGDQITLEEPTPLVYQELHKLARPYTADGRTGHLLQTITLFNEMYLRLIDWKNIHWQNRAHFCGPAAQLMRRFLVDFACAQQCEKRGGTTCLEPGRSVALARVKQGRWR